MNSRLSAISLVCAGLAVAAIPGYAVTHKQATKTPAVPPANTFIFPTTMIHGHEYSQSRTWTPTNQADAEERSRAAAEASSKKATTKKATSSWKSKYTVYVGCLTTPVDLTYNGPFGLQEALSSPALLEYTTVYVCYGNYAGDVVVATDHIKIEGQGDTSGDQNIYDYFTGPGNGQDPTDGSFGILLASNDDVVENLTFVNNEFGVGTSLLIQNTGSVVDHNYFYGNSVGVGSILGTGTVVENNTFNGSYFPVIALAGTDETFSGNTITGNDSPLFFFDDGIAVYDSVGDTITGNYVSTTANGLDFGFLNSQATVTNNHFDGNYFGIDIYFGNSGNSFSKNQVNGNLEVGIFSDGTSGLDAVPTSGVNSFVKNTTLGNFFYDIYDETAGYHGVIEGNNNDTADYYSGNTGDLNDSYPISIYQQ